MNSKGVEALAGALRRGELPDAQPWEVAAATQLLADSLAPQKAGVSVEELRKAAKILNQRKFFDHTRTLAQAWRERVGFDPTIDRHRAQALINLSALDEAEQVLKDGFGRLKSAGAHAESEIPEYEGLLGRLWKQRFVRSDDKGALEQSIVHYRAQYEGNPARPFWHGVNVAALIARRERDGGAAAGEGRAIAEKVWGQVRDLLKGGGGDQWAAATASEAWLALDDCDQAELWLHRFLNHPKVQPFDADSYGRQLREIWQGAPGGQGCASRLLMLLERHVARSEGRWSISGREVSTEALALQKNPTGWEKNFSGEGTFSRDAIKRMLECCDSIGCVCSPNGARLGTGFVVPGNALKESLGEAPVFVTNAHVISDHVPDAIAPANALVTFEVENEAQGITHHAVDKLLFTSLPGDLGYICPKGESLDVTIVRLKELTASRKGLDLAPALPLVEGKTRAYVVGHPRGSGMQISLHDSVLLDIDDDRRLVHYRTPTDPGSSGSPVFNSDFELIALHHGGSPKTPRLRGGGSYEANEGISIEAIRRKL